MNWKLFRHGQKQKVCQSSVSQVFPSNGQKNLHFRHVLSVAIGLTLSPH